MSVKLSMHGPPPPKSLDPFEATKPFFTGVDSDGCAFDTMEVKHKECFAPNFIRHFDLDAADGHARRVWAFVNLYSRWRGTNRFPALIKAFEVLDAWPEARRLAGRPAAPRTPAALDGANRKPKQSTPRGVFEIGPR